MVKIPAFVALDLETTGLDFEKDEIIEVALVRFENGEPKENLDFLVKPSSAELRPFIETLTGINKADLENASDFATIAGQICSFVGDLPIVAHNAVFDSKFLKQTFTKVGISYDAHVFWDSLTLSRIAFQDVPNHRLDTLVQELGIERSRAHRALPDADACGRLFVKALEKISTMDPWIYDALSKVAKGSGYETLFTSNVEKLSPPKYKLPAAPAVEALPKSKAPRVSEFFKEGGFISFVVDDYKPRHNQQDFASVMERNMYKGGLCVLEAPTGSGKTLSYLITAATKAITGERVLISTATRTLQEQLWTEAIPQIAKIYNGELRPAILKGRDNYLCLRKFEELLMHPQTLLSAEERDSFMALIPWVLTTETGDINECNSFSQSRNRVLWSKLSCSASCCNGENHSHHENCPALIAKRKAMNANMVLVNHSLFLSDLQLDFALLPSYEHIVFDEAHRLPEISNQTFGRSISFFGFRNIAKTLEPSKVGGDGLIAEIASRIPAEQPELHELCDKLSEALAESEKALHRFFMKIGKKLAKQKNGRSGFTYVNSILAEYEADPATFLEQYANARVIKAGKSANNRLYRSSSPFNSKINRASYVSEYLEREGVKTVLNLADTEAKMQAYDLPSYSHTLWDEGHVILCPLTADPTSDDNNQKLIEALKILPSYPAPYVVHCTEGKDRTGFACALLEGLCGATYEEMVDDYLITYDNYYQVSPIYFPSICEILVMLKLNPYLMYYSGVSDESQLPNIDYAEAFSNFLLSHGMNQQQLEALIQALTAK